MLKLKIPNKIFEEIIQEANAQLPIEACGILAGTDGLIEKYYKMTNADESRVHFELLPDEQFEVIKDIRAAGSRMLAIYHSHPDAPARLSQEDIRLALTPGVVYLILSLQQCDEPILKGFVVEDNKAVEVSIEIIKE